MWQVIGLCDVLHYGPNINININLEKAHFCQFKLYNYITMHSAKNIKFLFLTRLAQEVFIYFIFFTSYYSVQ